MAKCGKNGAMQGREHPPNHFGSALWHLGRLPITALTLAENFLSGEGSVWWKDIPQCPFGEFPPIPSALRCRYAALLQNTGHPLLSLQSRFSQLCPGDRTSQELESAISLLRGLIRRQPFSEMVSINEIGGVTSAEPPIPKDFYEIPFLTWGAHIRGLPCQRSARNDFEELSASLNIAVDGQAGNLTLLKLPDLEQMYFDHPREAAHIARACYLLEKCRHVWIAPAQVIYWWVCEDILQKLEDHFLIQFYPVGASGCPSPILSRQMDLISSLLPRPELLWIGFEGGTPQEGAPTKWKNWRLLLVPRAETLKAPLSRMLVRNLNALQVRLWAKGYCTNLRDFLLDVSPSCLNRPSWPLI